MSRNFREFLAENAVLFDGAMGTMLYTRGVFINACFDELNLRAPDLVAGVHRDYLAAGCDVIETNTFGGNRYKLEGHGLSDRVSEINRRGAEIARGEAGADKFVAGSIGPLGLRIEPFGKTSVEEAEAAFHEQALALAEGGADLFCLETFLDLNEIRQAVRACRRAAPDLPIVAQMTINEDGTTAVFGTPPEVFADKLTEWGADVVGVNCSVGPKAMLEVVERILKVTDRPVSALPNAGMPQNVDGRNIYLASPEYMSTYARFFLQAGVSVIGGCCGTTPGMIKEMRASLRMLRPRLKGLPAAPAATAEPTAGAGSSRRTEPPIEPVPFVEKSRLARKIAAGEFVVSAELLPPKSMDYSKVVTSARFLHEHGIDVINIPDGPRASARMSSMAMAVVLERDVGIETLLHYCCRDRNILGMQSDLLGAAGLGLKNLLIITGDPPKIGDYPNATAVFDVDAIGLTNMVSRLNHGLDLGANPVRPPTRFAIAVGANPGAVDLDLEVRRFEYKVEAGAEFAVTQPVFDVDAIKRFLDRIAHVRIPILAGIWPLVSLKNAEFMSNEVPGVTVAPSILERMRAAKTPEAQRAEGIAIAQESLLALRGLVQGVQISAPFGKVQVVLDVLSVLPKESAKRSDLSTSP